MQTLVQWQHLFAPLAKLSYQAAIAPANTFTGLSLRDRDPAVIEELLPLLGWLYEHYFRVQTDGWEHIPDGQVLMIGSHNGGLATPDTLMMTYDWFHRFGPERPIYALMEPRMWQALPILARLGSQFGAIQAKPQMALAALDAKASLVIYPGGAKDVFRPYGLRHQICFYGQEAFIKLALETEIPVVPMISYGAHATLIVLAEIHEQLNAIAQGNFPWLFGMDPGIFPIYIGLPWGIAFGPLPNIPFPVAIHTRVLPAIWFPRYGEAAARDRAYVDECYRHVEQTMQAALDQLVAEKAATSPLS